MAQISAIQPPHPQTLLPVQPNYNAVKIDINNPQVNTPGSQTGVASVYGSVPTASVYEVPQQSIYQPAAIQDSPPIPPPVIIQPSVNPSTSPAAPAAPPQEIEVKAPETMTPKVDLNEFINKLINNNYTYEEQVSAVKEIAATAKNSPEIYTELLSIFISKLTNNDYKEQAEAMKGMAVITKISSDISSDFAADLLLDVKVADTLLGIINNDTSKLEGPTPKQLEIREKIMSGKKVSEAEEAEANVISPMELAERKKILAIFTVTTLQKLYSLQIEKLYNNIAPLTELPGAASIVEQIKNNPNPIIRVACIEALSELESQLKRPEYKQDLTTLFTVAKNDKDHYVQMAAEEALKNLEQIPNPSTEESKAA